MRKKIISIALAAVVSVAAVFMPVSAATYHGVDIYNGTWIVDFSQLSRAKDFVYIKSSEGEHTADTRYETNVSGAKQFGMRWGPYHFLRMYSSASAVKQADYFWNRVKGSGYTIIPAVDCESHDGQQTAAGIRACIRAFVNEFQRVSGIKPVIYCSTSYANDILRGQFGDCQLWQADYRGYAGVVAGWSYSAWQYSSSGVVPGISNRADLDVTDGSIFTNSAPAAAADSQPKPSGSASGDVYAVKSMPYTYNATAKVSMQVTDSRGNAVSGRRVDTGDRICITGVDYARQLLEIVYPVKGGYMHGYVRNVPAQYRSRYYMAWHNGRTNEEVLTAGGAHLGTLYPHERATVLYKSGGKTAVLYGTGKGAETKSGLVRFTGVK
jgi:GH25 family lysozyme M1 (1,4-beta-N-acetylmuramidase)